jgi:hypothetical protein
MENNMSDKQSGEVVEFYGLTNRIVRSTVAVIDTIVQRGGFRGEELSTIGQLRDQCIQAVQLCEEFDAAQQSGEK